MRLLAALFLIRKLPLLTVFLIGLALLLPLFFVLLMLGRLDFPAAAKRRGPASL